MRTLGSVVRAAGLRDNGRYFGPDPDDSCPCGSLRLAKSCHRGKDHSWIAVAPPPLLDGPRTGYGNQSCYARSSSDCSRDVTREHWLSADLLKRIADHNTVLVEGAAWMSGAETGRQIGVGSLSSKMLCGRHNAALSPLDVTAATFFEYFRDDQLDLATHMGTREFDRTFTMINGPVLQLWLLKVIWGAIEARTVRVNGRIAERFRLGVTKEQLTEILWRGSPWPAHWGMHLFNHQGDHHEPVRLNSTRLRLVTAGDEILGGAVRLSGFEFCLAFEHPDAAGVYQPAALTLQRTGFPRSWKMFAFTWPELGHDPVNATSLLEPNADVFAPPPHRPPLILHRHRPPFPTGTIQVTNRTN